MNRWRIALGSVRRPKVGAVRDAASTIARVIGYKVESGVGHTPASREELMRGARQRAEALQAKLGAEGIATDFFVGLEGGLDAVVDDDRKRVFLQSWAYVSDGERGYFGGSGSIRRRWQSDGEGAWGILSNGLIPRRESFRPAVIAAFAPFYNTTMYRPFGGERLM